ncbi:MAG: SDR family oxidoreductase [Gemmatimonadetes bacterium]|nr:SDR family oxidoreductase [Gemmatimonadota bacterium]
MHIVVTGGNGFIARTLRLRLRELGHDHVTSLTRESDAAAWRDALRSADAVVHLAGVNRPPDPSAFGPGNAGLTREVCDALTAAGRRAILVLSSSTQAALDNPYGLSKRAAEEAVEAYAARTGARTCILRLPNVFGKWARPNYNSAVATFCHNLTRGLPITVHDPAAPLRLVYVDDVVETILGTLAPGGAGGRVAVAPEYLTTVGEVADTLRAFVASRTSLDMPGVGTGLVRALYATYVSYLPTEAFAYPLVRHADARGAFSEVLRTRDSGQFSFFTAHPGVTRGEHYHHTKTEKFLVVQGRARFGFRHIDTGERHALDVEGAVPTVVETVPGWVHDITNIGDTEMIVLLWANERFDPERPDTIRTKVAP